MNGIIHSPNFPEKYASSAQDNMTQQCHWFIHVRPGHKVLLYFEEFEVEGKPEGKIDSFWHYVEMLSNMNFL